MGGGGVKSFSCKTQPVRLRLGWGFDNYFVLLVIKLSGNLQSGE